MPLFDCQRYLFQRVRDLLPPDTSLVDAVAEALHLSEDSAYRRIRGETGLVLNEAATLCRQYGLSLDGLLGMDTASVLFTEAQAGGRPDFLSLLHGVRSALRRLAAAPEKYIVYQTSDLPFFYQFCFTPLIAFRYFFWMKTVFRHPDFAQRRFSFDCLPPDVEAAGGELLSLYKSIPSAEIWNIECVNSTLQQLRYHSEAGLIGREEASDVLAALQATMDHVHQQAALGCKFLPGENPEGKKENLRLFYNRLGLGDNLILTQASGRSTLYLNYDALNYLHTTDEGFCSRVHQQLLLLMQRSTLISGVSEKQRSLFFNAVYAKLQGEAEKVKPLA